MTKPWTPLPVSKSTIVTASAEIRDARDKELRDPDDVFIHAEERRKELAKQQRKKR
jgi:hypothetical protein